VIENTSTLPKDIYIGTEDANNLTRVYQFIVTPETLNIYEMSKHNVKRKARRMSDSQRARGKNQFAAVHQRHGWSECPRIERKRRGEHASRKLNANS